VDTSGNIYLADGSTYNNSTYQNDAVEVFPAGGASVTVLANSAAGLVNPQYVAVDLLGNLFIADNGGGTVDEYTAGSPPGAPLVTLENLSVNSPSGVAVDGGDNLFFGNAGPDEVEEFPAGTAPLAPFTTVVNSASGMVASTAEAVDSAGDLFIADWKAGQVEELPHAFVDQTPRAETSAAGSDSLPPVVPTTANLTGPFAPTTDAGSSAWLSITGVSGGVVSYSFTANTGPARTGYITVLGLTIPVTQSSPLYFGHSLYNTPQGPDGSPPLVILGEYDSAGPLQTSSVTLPNGTISDVKFYGGAYNFTVYVLQPLGLGANPNEQSFQVTASESFSGNAPVGIQTLPATGLPVAAGDLLAFAGVGPYYNGNESDALNTDATYGDASNPGAFSATAPGGTGAVFTVGLNSDPNVNYDYVPDVFGNQGRIYSFGVDVSETPVAAPYTILRAAGLPLHIFWSNVATNWSNPDGNPMTLTPFNPVSFQGVNLLENSAQILYPGTAPNVNDEINYTITDNYGETASGVINVVIINPFGQTGQLTTALTINNGNATVSFYGIIGLTYEIQRSTDLVNWVTIDTATVGSGGQITFIDTFPGLPSPPASAYYRLAWQP